MNKALLMPSVLNAGHSMTPRHIESRDHETPEKNIVETNRVIF